MATWQYAWMTDQPYTTIGFSHPQPGLAQELAGVLGTGVFMPQSTEWSISLDRTRVNLGYVSGLMGDRGWEMFAVETRLQPNAMSPAQVQTNWYFKRQGPDRVHGATLASESAAGVPAMGTAPAMGAAPAMPAMPAAPTVTAPTMPAAPAWPNAAPYGAPAAPSGPDQAPMTGGPTPPPGPGQG